MLHDIAYGLYETFTLNMIVERSIDDDFKQIIKIAKATLTDMMNDTYVKEN